MNAKKFFGLLFLTVFASVLVIQGLHIHANNSLTSSFNEGKILKCHKHNMFEAEEIVLVSLNLGYTVEGELVSNGRNTYDISQSCKMKRLQ